MHLSTVVLMALVVVCLGLLLVKVCSGTDEWKEVRIEPVVGSAAKDSVHVGALHTAGDTTGDD